MADCAVVCPAYISRSGQLRSILQMAASLAAQTDESWHLVLVDDASTHPDSQDAFRDVERMLSHKVTVLRRPRNSGQGVCRNVGASWASQENIPYCLYLDADDAADPRRVEVVRRLFKEDRSADFVYSAFDLIDELGNPVPSELVTPSIREILDSHLHSPPCGPQAWRVIALERGYTTLTSTVSVRTWIALAYPFPEVYVSEDQHAWLRMTAATWGVLFDASTKGLYRITTDGSGSSVRRRVGQGYYEQKAWVDTMGFFDAVRIALRLGKVTMEEVPEILGLFYGRCAETLAGEGREDAASEYARLRERVIREAPAVAMICLPARPVLFTGDNRQDGF